MYLHAFDVLAAQNSKNNHERVPEVCKIPPWHYSIRKPKHYNLQRMHHWKFHPCFNKLEFRGALVTNFLVRNFFTLLNNRVYSKDSVLLKLAGQINELPTLEAKMADLPLEFPGNSNDSPRIRRNEATYNFWISRKSQKVSKVYSQKRVVANYTLTDCRSSLARRFAFRRRRRWKWQCRGQLSSCPALPSSWWWFGSVCSE